MINGMELTERGLCSFSARYRILPSLLSKESLKGYLSLLLFLQNIYVCSFLVYLISRHIYRPYGRLWWDETVPTVVTVPSCHNQVWLFSFCSNQHSVGSYVYYSKLLKLFRYYYIQNRTGF